MFLPYILSIGCATSTLDGSSSRGYDGVLAADYSLKTEFLRIVELAFPSLLTFYDITTNNIFSLLFSLSTSGMGCAVTVPSIVR
jgi:hypothetical protein